MRTAAPAASLPIAAAFFLSGFAALVYQLAWQRLLFVMVGVDIESVTIIVSTFMLGLGLGAVLGGWLADRWPTRILLAFAYSRPRSPSTGSQASTCCRPAPHCSQACRALPQPR